MTSKSKVFQNATYFKDIAGFGVNGSGVQLLKEIDIDDLPGWSDPPITYPEDLMLMK